MALIKRATKLELEGLGARTIRASDYVTAGGEGEIYKSGQKIIKLYSDPKKIVDDNMTQKVSLLKQRLQHSSIVVPGGMVANSKGKVIGYHMPLVQGEAYPRLFTGDWRRQNQFTDESVTHLASVMHEVVASVHHADALMVDGNELNWLADVKDVRRPIPYAIDVDSWQIEQFKARAVMPSIRDWHSPISEGSDWFAWGIVTFLLYTGTHPYKGKLDGYKGGDLEKRMKDNASVFLPEVRLNKAVRDFSVIPGPLLDWYRATFQDGERIIPPSPKSKGATRVAIKRTQVVKDVSGGLVIEEVIQIAGEEIISVWPCGILRTDSGNLIWIKNQQVIGQVSSDRVSVTEVTGGWLIAEELQDVWQFRFINKKGVAILVSLDLPVLDVIRNDNRLFAITETELVELELQVFAKPILTVKQRVQILHNSTRWFGGVGVSDVFGAMHLVLPFGEKAITTFRVAELDDKRVVNGKALGNIVTLVTLGNSGQYELYTLAGKDNWRSYEVIVEPVDGPDLNQTILPKGVTASICDDGEIVIKVPTGGVKKVVHDTNISSDMRLANLDNQVVARQGDTLKSIRMK